MLLQSCTNGYDNLKYFKTDTTSDEFISNESTSLKEFSSVFIFKRGMTSAQLIDSLRKIISNSKFIKTAHNTDLRGHLFLMKKMSSIIIQVVRY